MLRYQKTHAVPSVSLPHGYVSDYEFFATASALHLPPIAVLPTMIAMGYHHLKKSPPKKFFIL